MASVKAEKPVGSQTLFGQPKKEPSKPSEGAPKAPASKSAPKKAEQKPREPKKKVNKHTHAYTYMQTNTCTTLKKKRMEEDYSSNFLVLKAPKKYLWKLYQGSFTIYFK